MRSNATVLLVEDDDEGRDLMAAWLQASGFDVTTCPGPLGPGYVCVGRRTGRCPLAEAADVVELDGRLECADVPEGTSPYDLLVLYRTLGRPVVVVGGDEDARAPLRDEEDLPFVDGPGGEGGGGEGPVGSVRRLVG